ncbi:hypothetical protein JVU11DRAFT_3952 [Chiua virens]|nr:hypothetical protein JVU11DRAFT_3952 [Chiua virens]
MSSTQRLVRFRPMTLEWLKRTEAAKNGVREEVDDTVVAVSDILKMPAHVGSSFGDLASMVPHEYPIPATNPLSPDSSVPHQFKAGYVTPPSTALKDSTTPKIALVDSWLHLHARPAELYITAWSFRGRMKLVASFDNNIFEHAVATEWLDEIKGAVVWYLGQTHESRQGRAEPRQGPQAKL